MDLDAPLTGSDIRDVLMAAEAGGAGDELTFDAVLAEAGTTWEHMAFLARKVFTDGVFGPEDRFLAQTSWCLGYMQGLLHGALAQLEP